jgi:hypothetical protein
MSGSLLGLLGISAPPAAAATPAANWATTNPLTQGAGPAFSPAIPWLTAQGAPGGAAASGLQSLGISPSSDPQTLANNINASPYAGSNPSNPYYSLILNQMAQQGGVSPAATSAQASQPWQTGGPSISDQVQAAVNQALQQQQAQQAAQAQNDLIAPYYPQLGGGGG